LDEANVAHCSGGFAEAVLLRRRYAVAPAAGESGDARCVPQGLRPLVLAPNKEMTSTNLRNNYLSKKSGICSVPPPKSQSSNGATRNVNNA
jgi:hypothetical protein